MSTHANAVGMTVTGTPGTGTITLNAATTGGARTFLAAYGAVSTTVDVVFEDPVGTFVGCERGAVYNGGSPGTLTRGTPETPGSAVSLTSAAVVRVAATADSGRRWDASALEHSTITGTSGAITAEVNKLYVADMSGWTADRTLTLPATAAVGDRVGVMVSVGDDAYEWLITAASGDTLNAIAGGTEWSRVFITGETVIMRCVAANATWIVEMDGRIPCKGSMTRTTAQTLANLSFVKILCATSEINIGGIVNTTNSRIDIRRAGTYLAGGFCRLDINSGKSMVVGIATGTGTNSVVARGQGMSSAAAGTIGVSAVSPLTLPAGHQVELHVYHDEAGNEDTTTVSDSVPRLYVTEQLP